MLALACAGCSRGADRRSPLVGASTTMVTAWQVPQNPLAAADGAAGVAGVPGVDDKRVAEQIKWGFKIFSDTPHEAARFTGGTVSCANCHLNAGQRDRALPLVGVAGMFPA